MPIARVGRLKYYYDDDSDLPDDAFNADGAAFVYRNEKDVFNDTAIASFNGKPVTDDHPPDLLDSKTTGDYIKGTVQNARRDGKFLVADLLIYDAELIDKIKEGKREVSCGYHAKYEQRGNKLYQVDIKGNHVAVVDSGRAGKDVAIKDSMNQTNKSGPSKAAYGRNKQMAKKGSMAGALANAMSLFHKDTAPKDVAEVMEDLVEAVKEEAVKTEDVVKDDTDDKYEALEQCLELICKALENLDEKVESIAEICVAIAESSDYNNEVSDVEGEEDVIEDPEVINAMDKDEAVEEIRKLKPYIAKIKDHKLRSQLSGQMTRAMRTIQGKPPRAVMDGYSAAAQRQGAKTQSDAINELKDKLAARLGKV